MLCVSGRDGSLVQLIEGGGLCLRVLPNDRKLGVQLLREGCDTGVMGIWTLWVSKINHKGEPTVIVFLGTNYFLKGYFLPLN
jgi:hypothetical protein